MATNTLDQVTGKGETVAVKAACVVQTTANITLSGEQTINSVAVVADDRVLVKDQTDATENGIYICGTGLWQRADDFNEVRDVVSGTLVAINGTSTLTFYKLNYTGSLSFGSTNLNFIASNGGDSMVVEFADLTALKADTNTYAAGVRVDAGGATYVTVSSGGSVSNSASPTPQTFVPFIAASPIRDYVVTPQHFATTAELEAGNDAAMIAWADASVATPGGIAMLPSGIYTITPDLELFRDAMTIKGEGRNRSQLIATEAAGSILSRQWSPSPGTNDYLQSVHVSDIGIILRHPATADPANYSQVGLDTLHVTRSLFENIYVGNYPFGISSDTVGAPSSQANSRQGRAVVGGTTSAGNPAYSGGEVNEYHNIFMAGIQKGAVIDDPVDYDVSSSSASYGCTFLKCEAQICEMGFGQLSQYGAGNSWYDCAVQSVNQATGSSETTYEWRIEGFDNTIIGGLSEDGGAADYNIYFFNTSKRNVVSHRLNANAAAFTDLGTDNVIKVINRVTGRNELFENRGANDLNRMRAQASVVFTVAATVVTIEDSTGVASVVRNSIGDYTITFDTGVFDNGNWEMSANGAVNNSANIGTIQLKNLNSAASTGAGILSWNITTAALDDFGLYQLKFFGGRA